MLMERGMRFPFYELPTRRIANHGFVRGALLALIITQRGEAPREPHRSPENRFNCNSLLFLRTVCSFLLNLPSRRFR